MANLIIFISENGGNFFYKSQNFPLFFSHFLKKNAKLRNVAIKENKQGVCHTLALPFTSKGILRQKKELWKLKYSIMQKYNLQKTF